MDLLGINLVNLDCLLASRGRRRFFWWVLIDASATPCVPAYSSVVSAGNSPALSAGTVSLTANGVISAQSAARVKVTAAGTGVGCTNTSGRGVLKINPARNG